MKSKRQNLLARAGWTAAQAVLGVVTVEALGIPVGYAVLVATLLSAAKTYVADRLSKDDVPA